MPIESVPPLGAPVVGAPTPVLPPRLSRPRAGALAACAAVFAAAAALAPVVTPPLAAQRAGTAASRKHSAKAATKSSTKKSAKTSARTSAKTSAKHAAARPATSARPTAVAPAPRPDSALRAFQVDTVAEPIPETLAPRYPRELRSSEVRGSVVAEFVVDTAGRVEPGTFRVISSDDPAFTTSVRELLPRARFLPAINEGHLVRQTVRQTFVFDLDVLQRPRTAGAP